MLVLPMEDFLEEIKAEMYGYEEISEAHITRWFDTMDMYIKKKKKSERLVYSDNRIDVKLKDESDLFMIVDRYLAAIAHDDLEAYYTDWKL